MSQADPIEEAFPLRSWAVFQKTKALIEEGTCNELCSLRFTWLTPAAMAGISDPVYGVLAGLIDLARQLAKGNFSRLHIEKVPERSNLFALLSFDNGVVAEFEINECCPDSMRPVRFLLADCKEGRVTNRPLVGHENVEGALYADASGSRNVTFRPEPTASAMTADAEILKLVRQAMEDVK